jgi:hypothetical protein
MQAKNPKVSHITDARINSQRGSTDKIYQFGGRPAPPIMQPGKYPVTCTAARIGKKGNKTSIVLMYEVSAGNMSGVELLQWLALPEKGKKITHRMDVWKHFTLVLGQAPSSDDFDEQLFVGRSFLAYVGFTQRDPDTGQTVPANAEFRKKHGTDFLRVHTLLEVLP